MKILHLCIMAFAILFTSQFAHARDNQALCNEWCKTDKTCEKCSSISGCGPGYSPIATFKGYGKNWFGCRQNTYGRRSERNEEACKQYCKEESSCEKCTSVLSCGTGYTRIMSFTGTGKNWHACRKTVHKRASEKNKQECKEWCAANELCVKCDTKRECGRGLTSMKHFDGAGTNWHACRKTGSESNQAACQQWCDNHSKCTNCSKKAGCGRGYKSIKMFKGPGKNWFACEKR